MARNGGAPANDPAKAPLSFGAYDPKGDQVMVLFGVSPTYFGMSPNQDEALALSLTPTKELRRWLVAARNGDGFFETNATVR